MRYTHCFIPTYKEVPSEAEVVSHQLMLRAGMIRKLAAGVYTYLPAGLRSVKKVENIVREEMNRAGAIEILMPAVQPAELWKESGRWDYYGRELLRFRDRHERDACFGPTHEEVITDLVRREIHSYKQMPVNFYQIQTKFRDEIRPRFGLMRCREFIMKDGYSFDADDENASKSYERMHEAYTKIFRRCGLVFNAVEADTGAIGGSHSHEFMVIAETGEDSIVSCKKCGYAANLEKAEILSSSNSENPSSRGESAPLEEVETPDIKTVEDLTAFMDISADQLVKTLIFSAGEQVVAALVRGDHELNEAKFKSFLRTDHLEMASPELVAEATGAPTGFAGPAGLKIKIYADNSVRGMSNFVTGGNKKDTHFRNVNMERDFLVESFGDLRVITPRDHCPRCGADIHFSRGIEVGHIFKLGRKYSRALNACFLDQNGKEREIFMGCYGIGIGRTVAAAIEQNHDEKGMILPVSIAPFEATILPLQMHDGDVVDAAEKIYGSLLDKGVDTLLDDRQERAGIKFNDADLLGAPVRVTVGSRGLKDGLVELRMRPQQDITEIPLNDAAEVISEKVKALYDSIK